MKNAKRKNTLRSIWQTKSRFLSIFAIVTIGMGFFAGLTVTAPDMKLSADRYYKQQNMADFRLISTYGFNEDDVAAVAALEGVTVYPGYFLDVLMDSNGTEEGARILSLSNTGENNEVNKLILTSGRFPEKADECLADMAGLSEGKNIGDKITLSSGTNDHLSDSLKNSEYTVVGTFNSPLYIDKSSRGNTNVGNGTIQTVIYVPEENFLTEVYTQLYVTVQSLGDFDCYSDDYINESDRISEILEAVGDKRETLRYDEIVSEAEAEIDDAQKELDEAKAEAEKELDDALKEIQKGELELKDAEQQLQDAEKQLSDSRNEIDDGWEALAEGEQTLIDETSSAQKEIDENRTTLENARREYERGLAEYQDGLKQYNEGFAQYQDGLEQYNEKYAEFQQGVKEYNDAYAKYLEGVKQYEAGKEQYEIALVQYNSGYSQYLDGLKQYNDGKTQYDVGEQQYNAGYAAYQEALKQYNEGYEQYQQGLEQYQTLLEIYNAAKEVYNYLAENPEEIDKGLEEAEKELNRVKAELELELLRQELYQTYYSNINSGMDTEEALETLKADLTQSIPGFDPESFTKEDIPPQGDVEENIERYSQLIHATDKALEYTGEIKEQLPEIRDTALEEAKALLDSYGAQLEDLGRQLEEAKAELESGQAQLDDAKTELDSARATLDASKKQLEDAKAVLDASEIQLEEGKAQLDEGAIELEAAKAEIENGGKQLAEAKAEIDDGERQLKDAKEVLDETGKLLEDSKAQLDEGAKELEDAKAQIEDGEKQLEDGQKTLNEESEKALNEIAENRALLEDAEIQYSDGLKDYEQGKIDYAEGVKKLEDGKKEYEDGKREAEEKFAEAERKIKSARRDLKDLKNPQWYIFNREENPGYAEYGENADRIANIASVFPAFFLLVAALVCLTTMTRMVEEERTQIGTMKALGYGNDQIISKYIFYAVTATILGAILGIVGGQKLFPIAIMSAYGMMYTLGNILAPVDLTLGAIGLAVAIAMVTGVVYSTCRMELQSEPAQLMRPKAPKAGKRILLEHTPLWKHMSFNAKVSCRNLFRYKRRMLMTTIGVAGCTALLLVGFGIRDSISEIVYKQYGELNIYDGLVSFDSDDQEEIEELREVLNNGGDSVMYYQKQITARTDNGSVNVYIAVPENSSEMDKYFIFRDRNSHQQYHMEQGSVLIDEKLAEMLGVKEGDSFSLYETEDQVKTVKVGHIFENYPYHYVYMTREDYELLFGKEAPYNVFAFSRDDPEENRDEYASTLISTDGVIGVRYSDDIASSFSTMLKALDSIIYIIIVSAGALAFVVLYNLTNININERIREIATLKVLGFFDREVDSYIFRENIMLTLMGTAVGLFGGTFLTQFIIVTAEVDLVMFGRDISVLSYVFSAVITMAFSVAVSLFMHRYLKKVDMIEALKSIE